MTHPAQRVISSVASQDQETRFQDQVTSVAITGPHGGTWPDASGLLACEYDRNRPLPAFVARRIGHIVPAGSAEPMNEDLQRDQPTVQR